MLNCLKNHWRKLLFLSGHIYILYQKVLKLRRPTVLKHSKEAETIYLTNFVLEKYLLRKGTPRDKNEVHMKIFTYDIYAF